MEVVFYIDKEGSDNPVVILDTETDDDIEESEDTEATAL